MTRYAKASDYTAPRGHCRYCKRKVEPPKQSWCSEECVEEYLIRRSPGDARRAVFSRDAGVCAECGTDTVALAGTLDTDARVRSYCRIRAPFPSGVSVVGRLKRGVPESALWDMDHILPVKDGGGGCGLDNLQTLCLWCHDRKTHERDAKAQLSLEL